MTVPGSRVYAIGDIARKAGLTPRTVRYYEDIGLLASVRRVEGGRRVYTDDDLRRLKFITRLKVLGLTLDEMKELEDLYLTHGSNDQVLPHLLELLDRHLDTIESRIEQLAVLKRDIQDYKRHLKGKI
jgi:DNA-binding transcriptional MerR regulator